MKTASMNQLASVQTKILQIISLLQNSNSPYASGTFLGIYQSALSRISDLDETQLSILESDLNDALIQLK